MNQDGEIESLIADDPIKSVEASCLDVLRMATRHPHERLHRHDGFVSVKDGTISLADYRALLRRLHGFHRPFERAVGGDQSRTRWLERDLAWLGDDHATLSGMPSSADFPRFDSPEPRLGALYVVEGSALGGRQLSRGLDGLLGADAVEGRRFFIGRGAGTGAAWSGFLGRLATVGADPMDRAAIVGAAIETFDIFETWLGGWSDMR